LNSKGEYVFLADSDFVFESGLVEEVVKCFEEKKMRRNFCARGICWQ